MDDLIDVAGHAGPTTGLASGRSAGFDSEGSWRSWALWDQHVAILWAATEDYDPVLLSTLSPVERARMSRYVFEADQRSFALGALIIRFAAASLDGCDPRTVDVHRVCSRCGGPHGRPRVAGRTSVSVSRSGRHVAVAVSRSQTVGLDIERHDNGRVVEGVLQSGVLGVSFRPQTLCDAARWWTRYEAVTKLIGEGLHISPTELTESRSSESAVHRVWHTPGSPSGVPLGVTNFSQGEHVGAIAFPHADREPAVRHFAATELLETATRERSSL